MADGGDGSYVSGYIDHYDENIIFNANVGGSGIGILGGYNGGGNGFNDGIQYGGGSGGATDIRINSKSASSRIMVAAGGSGGILNTYGEPGGDLKGRHPDPNKITYIYDYSNNCFYANGVLAHTASDKTNQTNGGADGIGDSPNETGNGGGGGFYGGKHDIYLQSSIHLFFAHSGSSYISGHDGCVTHESGIVFNNTTMEIGSNEGNGKIVLTLIPQCPENCSNCTSNVCYECEDGSYLLDNECLQSCPDGYIAVDGKCEEIESTTNSEIFKSMPFTDSKKFKSMPFTDSEKFKSVPFTDSEKFKSVPFTNSEKFKSVPFTDSEKFKSILFSTTICFTQSNTFEMNSDDSSGAKSSKLKTYAIVLIIAFPLIIVLIITVYKIIKKQKEGNQYIKKQQEITDYTSEKLLFNQKSEEVSSFYLNNSIY